MIKKIPNKKFWRGKKIFITGHTSFKGTWLKIWLESLGAKVKGYSIDYPSNPYALYKMVYKEKFKKEDILNFKYLKKKIIEFNPQIIIHLAAQSIISEADKYPMRTFNINTIGTASVLEAATYSKKTQLVAIITTDKCYEDNRFIKFYNEDSILGGSEPYSSSKACAEIISKSYLMKYKKLNKKIITLRAGNVVGGGDWKKDRLVPDILNAIKLKKKLILRKPNSSRPWQHVLDCLNGYLLSIEYSSKKNIFFNTWNFSPPLKNQIKVIDFVKQIIPNFNYPFKNIKIKKIKLYETKKLNLSAKKANKEIKWQTILSSENLIKFIVDWYDLFYKKTDIKLLCLNQINQFCSLAKKKNGIK